MLLDNISTLKEFSDLLSVGQPQLDQFPEVAEYGCALQEGTDSHQRGGGGGALDAWGEGIRTYVQDPWTMVWGLPGWRVGGGR